MNPRVYRCIHPDCRRLTCGWLCKRHRIVSTTGAKS
jgi:hypothetical protein